ncbi:prepilin-type N-terminal cleavage/methylation domain-containing protein [Bacillus tianshenii]|nr:prepilin-type N-terminal cleavage/methylation domain-containing protein [Bacillus tianshenii]
MNHFDKYIRNDRGLTLIELLATITISAFIIGGISTVLIMGVNTFNKTMVEGEIRDEADYLASMVMKEIYEFSPDYVEELNETGKTGIIAYKFSGYTINDEGVLLSPKGKEPAQQLEIFLEENAAGSSDLKVIGPFVYSTTAEPVKILNENGITIEESSKLTVKFSQGDTYKESGQLSLQLSLTKNPVESMLMESTFGF